MDIKELINGTFEDYWSRLDNALEGLTSEELAWRPQDDCNPISFIAWHMARVEDRFFHHFAMNTEEVWVKNDWFTQFGLDATDHGVRFTLEQVAAFPAISPELLSGYLNDVRQETRTFIQDLKLRTWTLYLAGLPSLPIFHLVRRSGRWATCFASSLAN